MLLQRLMKEYIYVRRGQGEILILGYTSLRAYELFRYNLSQTIADVEHAKELNSFGKPIQIHIKINTGMNRLGESYKHVSEIASVFNCKTLRLMVSLRTFRARQPERIKCSFYKTADT